MRDGYDPEPKIAAYVPPGVKAAQSSRLAASTIPAGIPPGAPPPLFQHEVVQKPRRRGGGAGGKQAAPEGNGEDGEMEALAACVEKAELDPVKMIKKLEKKLREIDEIFKKAADLRTQEQLDKAARKAEIAAELSNLKNRHV